MLQKADRSTVHWNGFTTEYKVRRKPILEKKSSMETTGSNKISAFFDINFDANFPAILAYQFNFIIKLFNVTLPKTH